MTDAKLAAAESGITRQVKAVLNRDRDTMQRPQRDSALDRCFGKPCFLARLFRAYEYERIQLRIQCLDLPQMRVQQLDR